MYIYIYIYIYINFPKSHRFRKILSLNTLKLSYRSMDNATVDIRTVSA